VTDQRNLTRWTPVCLSLATWVSVAAAQTNQQYWWAIWLASALAFAVRWHRKGLPTKHFVAGLALPLFVVVRSAGFLGTPSPKSDFITVAAQLRARIAAQVVGLTPNSKALTLGITDGDSTLLSPAFKTIMRQMSLSHLTAVSGTNCTILIVAIVATTAMLGLGRTTRVVVALLVLGGYLVLVGDQPSVVRAAVMAAVSLFALLNGKRHWTPHLLALAVLLLLLFDPSNAVGLGFTLSVAATAGVILLAPRLRGWLSVYLPGWLALSISVALAAQLACLPFLIGVQGNFSLGGLLANLLAEPVVAPVTILGFLGSVLSLGAAPLHLAQGVFWVASIGSAWIETEALWLASHLPSISIPGGWASATMAFALLVAAYFLPVWRGHRLGWLAPMALLATLVVVGVQLVATLPTGNFPVRNWFMVSCDVGQGDATVLRAGGEYAVIDVGRDPNPVDSCLSRLGVKRISILVLTHFDLDHVGGLSGALAGRRVDEALLTQFQDPRPEAKWIEQTLVDAGITVRHVEFGDNGVLGSPGSSETLRYLVLNPHHEGADADSANDGSVAMFWVGYSACVFTMADVPATGQDRILADLPGWWSVEYSKLPVVLKLSHHGSADQSPAFLKWVHPLLTTISVGRDNSYGHPTQKALDWLARDSAVTIRTDQMGSISIGATGHGDLTWSSSGRR